MKRSIQSITAVCLLVVIFYASTAMGHGRVAMAEDPCARHAGGNMVHLSAYQPQYDQKEQYCTEIPIAGDTYFVVDLVDQPLRGMPVSLKIFRGDDNEGETVAQVKADYHPDGVISGIGKLDKGLYSVVVTAEGIPPLQYAYQLRVDMIDYGNVARAWAGPLIAVLFLSWLMYRLIQSGRWRQWLGSRNQ